MQHPVVDSFFLQLANSCANGIQGILNSTSAFAISLAVLTAVMTTIAIQPNLKKSKP